MLHQVGVSFDLYYDARKHKFKIHENPSTGGLVIPCGGTDGRTERHDEAESHMSQFCERASRNDRRLLPSGKLLAIYLLRLFHDVIYAKYNSQEYLAQPTDAKEQSPMLDYIIECYIKSWIL